MNDTAEMQPGSLAARIAAGGEAIRTVCCGIIALRSNNLVERPWGGLRMLDYKGNVPLPDQKRATGLGIGEAFEVAACDSDPETREHPSVALLSDGSQITLPELMSVAGAQILGASLHARSGGEIPLLPKTLDVAELLSVQAHPPGNTEVYVILDADPGATIRLGFRHSVDADSLREELVEGRDHQQRLAALLREDGDLSEFNQVLAALLAHRDELPPDAREQLSGWLRAPADGDAALALLESLREVYWHVLDLMNEIVVRPGQVLHNATPARICTATGAAPSAEVHALGNPERREILMLEIRRPGVTYRAWDNVRFPMREIDIDRTLAALNLSATSPEEFEVSIGDQSAPGVFGLVRSDAFVVEELHPRAGAPVTFEGGRFATLHIIEGEVVVHATGASQRLAMGQSGIVPAACPGGRIETGGSARLIRVYLP